MAAKPQWGETAQTLLSRGQKIGLRTLALLAVLCVVAIGLGFISPMWPLRLLMGAITLFYLLFVGMKIVISIAGARFKFPVLELPTERDPDLPTYTILVPLFRETRVLPNLVEALSKLVYPTSKLQILLLLEATDLPMIEAVRAMNLPNYFEMVIVRDSFPQTKPKACNFAMGVDLGGGLEQRVTGKRLVIFDAEDRPEPLHLLKAVAAMKHEQAKDPRVVCVQAILKFWNPRSGVSSAFYWGEYIVHFRWMLTGFAKLGLIPPLGGTSNHFEVEALEEIEHHYQPVQLTDRQTGQRFGMLSVWDAYNVTEDADLAARLARRGYRIAMVDAITFEEAPNTLRKARKQRRRWIKGYGQTGLVHSRRPLESMQEMGVMRYLCFNFFMLGTMVSQLLSPVMWSLTATYIISRLVGWQATSLFIEGLFPAPIYYPSMLGAVVGNVFFLYQKLVTPLQQEEYGLSKRLLLTPLWWGFTSISAYQALIDLLRPSRRSYWDKTEHGHDQDQEQAMLAQSQVAGSLPSANGGVPGVSALPQQADRGKTQA